MLLKALPMVFVLTGVVLYTVLAGADFGAGFWQLFAGGGERSQQIRDHAHHSMAPVWEANHVWLIFVLTGENPGGIGHGATLALLVGACFAVVGAIFSRLRLFGFRGTELQPVRRTGGLLAG